MMFRAWVHELAHDVGADTEEKAKRFDWEYDCPTVADAARVHTSYRLANLGSDYWPVTIRVRDLSTNKLYNVTVARVVEYRFAPGEIDEVIS